MRDYSQFHEQIAILNALNPSPETPGRFLDIGAFDPITFSNTRALVELGWSGVMIEPAPGPMIELLRCCTKCGTGVDEREHETYGNRKGQTCGKCGGLRYGFDPRFELIQTAVGIAPAFVEIMVTDDALSSSDPKHLKKWGEVGGFYGRVFVPVITVEEIKSRWTGFSFVNIDAEGISADLLKEFFRLGMFPPVLCCEHDGRTTELLEAATRHGYRAVLVNHTNVVIARP